MSQPRTIICPNCQAVCDANNRFCGNCRYPLAGSEGNHPTVPNQQPQQGRITRVFDNIIDDTLPAFTPHPPSPHQRNTRRVLVLAGLLLMLIVATFIGVQIGKGNTPGTSNTTQHTPPTKASPNSGTPLATSNPTQTPTPSPSPTITPTPTQIPTPTPTTPPQPGTVLWQANWSGGMNGWGGSSDWQAANGILTNNGQQGNSVSLAPYSPGDYGIADYAVEAQIQFLRYSQAGAFGGLDSFGILVHSTDGQPQDGYLFAVCASAGIDDCGANTHEIYVSNGNQNFTEYPWQSNPGETHTYRIEVKGNVVRVLIDGRPFLKGTDNTYLSGGEIGLMSNQSQISVNSFKVIAL